MTNIAGGSQNILSRSHASWIHLTLSVTMFTLWNISQYCTGAMSRVRLIGLITAVCTPFGLDTSMNKTAT